MPTRYPVPKADVLQDVLSALVGAEVRIALQKQPQLDEDAPAVLAEFVDEHDSLGALCRVDHTGAISLAGALNGTPADAVEQAIEGYRLDDQAVENTREIVNVLAQLFNSDHTPRMRFRDLHRQPGKLPDATQQLRRAPAGVRHFSVTVPGFSAGLMSFLIA
jgi:hypothetical protein